MHHRQLRWIVLAAVLFVSLAVALPTQAQQKLPDYTLFTTYSVNQSLTDISWLTCGSTQLTEGCYGSGNFGPFTDACAIVQSVPAPLNLNTVLRYIYVLDSGSGTHGVTLSVYKRTDMVTSSTDNITITTITTVSLPSLVGGSGVSCSMANNPSYIYAATNQSMSAAAINKTTYSVSSVGDFDANVNAITADSYGYVTILQGDGFTVYGPNGSPQEDGGGVMFRINPIDALYPSSYAPTHDGTLPQVGYWPKAAR
jgi:hypothetical protein